MPRKPRQVTPGAPHHVVLRGNNRRILFSYPRDYQFFLFLVAKRLEVRNLALHAFCLMSNHAHLLITPFDGDAMWTFVKNVAQRYAQVRNRKVRATGKLFEERYYSKGIASERHLAIATAYIDLNPVRAGRVEDAASYRWSTFALHAGMPPEEWCRELWSPSTWYASLAGTAEERGRMYREWAADCLARDEWHHLYAPTSERPTGEARRPDRSRAAG